MHYGMIESDLNKYYKIREKYNRKSKLINLGQLSKLQA